MPPPWHRGRVLLIGDAAHTTTPHHAQGAAMAVEDAVVLSELLRRDGDLEDVLEQFMERRWSRCRLVVEASVQVGEWEQNPSRTSVDDAISSAITSACNWRTRSDRETFARRTSHGNPRSPQSHPQRRRDGRG